MSDISFGQWSGSGAEEYGTGAEAFCTGKVFYISGLTVTKRKTGIRAQGGTTLKNMAAPCTTNATLAMSVIFKGNSEMWPTLFNRRYTIPVSYPYINTNYVSLTPYTFYVPTVSLSYFSPDRKFYFSLSNIGVCIPKEFFNISVALPKPTQAQPNPTQTNHFDYPHVTSDNLQYLEGTKQTPTTFYFKSFEWNSGYSYCYNSLSRTLANSNQDPFSYIGQQRTTARLNEFNTKCLGIFPSFSFLAADYCYEIENGNLYFRNLTLVPCDPEISDIIGIESISCKLTNSL
jgi:hypothetical protein